MPGGQSCFFLFSTVTKFYAESFGLRIKLMWASGWYLDPVDICEKVSFLFYIYLVIFIVIFCFSCLILFFCYLCQSGMGLGFVVYLYFCGRGEKICCFDLFVNPPSNFIFLLLDLFFDTTRDHLKQRVFLILSLFLLCLFIILSVPVYESFANNTCTHLYYIP